MGCGNAEAIHMITHSFDIDGLGKKDNFRIGPLTDIFPIDRIDGYCLVPCYFYMSRYDYLGQSEENYQENFAKKSFLVEQCCELLKDFKALPEKHIFFLVGDDWNVPEILQKSIVFQLSASKNSKSLAVPYYNLAVRKLISVECFDMSFVGNFKSHPIRQKLVDSLPKKVNFIQDTKIPFEFHTEKNQQSLARLANGIMNASEYVLCPRGVGLNSIRFFEALSLGKTPILISDDCKLPLESCIDYDRLIIRVPESDLNSLEDRIVEFEKANYTKDALKIYESFLHISVIQEFVRLSLEEYHAS